jgi:hypothetical protein
VVETRCLAEREPSEEPSSDTRRCTWAGASAWDAGFLGLLVAFTLPNTLPMLRLFFSDDDLRNLYYYAYYHDPWYSLVSNLWLFTSFNRPAGALFYLPAYGLFGFDPLPLYAMGLGLFYLNLALIYFLALRLTGSRVAGVVCVTLCAFHFELHNVLYNFGAVYELVALTGLVGALHCYLCFTSTRRAVWYAGTLLCWAFALNAKEVAVGLPLLLAAYELLYLPALCPSSGRPWSDRPWSDRLRGTARRMSPLLVIALVYTAAKMLGDEALWRVGASYQYQLDLTFYRNLGSYLGSALAMDGPLSAAGTTALLLGAIGVAAALRSCHLAFALLFTLVTIAPVLPLPRVWTLWLYVPLVGVGLYLGVLCMEAGRRLLPLIPPAALETVRRGAGLVGLVAAAALFWLALTTTRSHLAGNWTAHHSKSKPWHELAPALAEWESDIPAGSIFGLEGTSFDAQSRWILHLMILLQHRSPDILVWVLPEDRERFEAAMRHPAERRRLRLFRWQDGELVEAALPGD